uniref:Uncharacterized protein n=1 Tax=Leersia perrieri TaxID=77586 RepID=A0A0D9W4C5_9ORYZ
MSSPARAPVVELDFLGLRAADADHTKSSSSCSSIGVNVFDVSNDKAEAIMKIATEATKAKALIHGNAIVGNFAKEPLTRTKSLQRFLTKRKESLSPYKVGGPGGVDATTTTTASIKSFRRTRSEMETDV